MHRFLLILLALFCLAAPAVAAPKHAKAPVVETDATLYHRAFEAIASNDPQKAEDIAAHGHDQILSKIVRGYAMALPGNEYSFEELNAFIAGNPGWPGLKGIQMIAEQKMPTNGVPSQIVAWFQARPPVTLAGFYRYIDALNQSGAGPAATAAIHTRWVESEFTGDDLTAFSSRFGSSLDATAMWLRMDHLLWKDQTVDAKRLMPYLNATDQAVAQARLALASGDSNAAQVLARVPSDAQNEPGLQYQKLRWLIKRNQDSDADDILAHPPSDLGNAEAWWDLRQVMVRRAIEAHDYNLAYHLASEHGQTDSKTVVQAEFLAGWLALRFLNKPDIALTHFQTLYDSASTPVTQARGAYWLGRSHEAMNNKNDAEQSYEDAAAFNTTYYGQLAETRLYAAPVLTAKADPPLPDSARHAFMSRDIIRAIIRLNDIGENDRARSFFHAATESATERGEFVVLTEVAAYMGRPDLSIQAVKAAAQKNMLVETGGFPTLNVTAPTPPEPAFTHALIRQESMFNPDASSPVGAQGLMQLMPRTAKDTAKHLGVPYMESRLNEPAYNLKLGTAYVQEQIDHFNGSYILALAGYNAGAGRVHEWLGTYGDPRKGEVDPVDWVELIPIQETRNYVQRIMENVQIYRTKLAGGHAPLLILNDLKK